MKIPETAMRVASLCVPSTASQQDPRRADGPERSAGAGEEDGQVSGDRQHQVHHRLELGMVEVEDRSPR
jgi:hypothetical protein